MATNNNLSVLKNDLLALDLKPSLVTSIVQLTEIYDRIWTPTLCVSRKQKLEALEKLSACLRTLTTIAQDEALCTILANEIDWISPTSTQKGKTAKGKTAKVNLDKLNGASKILAPLVQQHLSGLKIQRQQPQIQARYNLAYLIASEFDRHGEASSRNKHGKYYQVMSAIFVKCLSELNPRLERNGLDGLVTEGLKMFSQKNR